jgi:hypothetical protein
MPYTSKMAPAAVLDMNVPTTVLSRLNASGLKIAYRQGVVVARHREEYPRYSRVSNTKLRVSDIVLGYTGKTLK